MAWTVKGINCSFIEDALSTRTDNGLYYVLSPEYEYIVRMNAYWRNKRKKHHFLYLKEHIQEYESELSKKYLDFELEELLQ